MENLHLKNLIQKPHPLIILQKLNDENYCYDKYIPEELINKIELYITSLTFKNKDVEKFTMNFLANLKCDNIKWVLTITQQIITLLYKYKLNELDVNDYFDFEKINKEIYETQSYRKVPTDKTEIQYAPSSYTTVELRIYSDKTEKNKIAKIYRYTW